MIAPVCIVGLTLYINYTEDGRFSTTMLLGSFIQFPGLLAIYIFIV